MNGGDGMARKSGLAPLPLLKDEQKAAAHPASQVRLSASAGTGKTQVLTARVLRLLLHGVDPEAILCLTFTKAGAAQMADRIHDRLGAWVTMSGVDLANDLKSLGEAIDPGEQYKARQLFAKILDARGSGLRIQTIHSFCQTLLANFPAEAGLPAGFRLLEGRDEEAMADQSLAAMVDDFARSGRLGDFERLRNTVRRLSEEPTRKFLRRCAQNADAFTGLPQGEGLYAFVRRGIIGIDDIEAKLTLVCNDGGFDRAALITLRDMFGAWRKKDGSARAAAVKAVETLNNWLAAEPDLRRKTLLDLQQIWLKQDGGWRTAEPDDPDYHPTAHRLNEWISRLIELQKAADIAPIIGDALTIGRAYAEAYVAAKRSAGVVDFGDMIRNTVSLLKQPGIGDWIRFKLDQSVDHVLVDEAQDTNAAQWDIVKALTEEFFAGDGAKAGKSRTIFTVGDFKQAIFGFQGTDPNEFEAAGAYFAAQSENADQEMELLSLSRSFRSSQPILDVTDQVIGVLGFAALGLPEAPEHHESALAGLSGRVTLWPAVTNVNDEEDQGQAAEENWLSSAELSWAKQLAARIKDWTTGGLMLRNQNRVVEPGDIMILLRNRGELARLIVSRLYEVGVAVAGVDRLRLNAPIAVQDLLACIRFALQPQDDLSLACLLVSPLMNWSQDKLYQCAKGRDVPLWQHLRQSMPADTLAFPARLLAIADMSTPYAFLEDILSGESKGRQKMIARLGEEARDQIEELLNAALAFESQSTPSLQLFIDWFDRGNVDIKRDPAKPENAVRIMTAHGAKGLEAPVVILADATSDPGFKRKDELDWIVDGATVPLFRPKSAETAGSLADSANHQDARELEEHWRLLYVAMTRAEEYLFIGGALKPKQLQNGMSDQCWHVQVERALAEMPGAVRDEEGLSLSLVEKPKPSKRGIDSASKWDGPLPDWALCAAAPESRPPRPLAPSKLETLDSETFPPPTPALRQAAVRGTRLHALFERLPVIAPDLRRDAADRWLDQGVGMTDPVERADLINAALAVIDHPEFAAIFGPESYAELPIAGVSGGRVVAGTVDRLLVREREVIVVDFKTGRRVPVGEAQVSIHHKAQMAAYVAVLTGIFPGRSIRAALLYTHAPQLIELSADCLAAHKPGFSDQQQVLA
jgi:ATP-dependent helicase/nuclease subunit A